VLSFACDVFSLLMLLHCEPVIYVASRLLKHILGEAVISKLITDSSCPMCVLKTCLVATQQLKGAHISLCSVV